MVEKGSNAGGYGRDEYLLHRYTKTGAESAFAELMQRHMAFVYSVCLRELADRALSQDAAQVVFLVLARRAGGIRNGRALATWLFRTAVLTARDLAKQEQRRQMREQILMREAMRQDSEATADERALWLRPELNAALATLKGRDLECVLLHYLQGMNLRETGLALGVSEDAARKRVSRALQKMRRALAGRGVIIPIAILASALAGSRAHALSTAPPALCELTSTTLRANLKQMHLNRLAEGVSRTMKFARIRTIAAWASLPILLLGGIGLARAHAGLGRSLRPSLQADLAAPAPPASLLPDLQLPQPFTLMFDATQRAIRTPATVALRLKQRRAALDAQVAAGTLTRAEADDQYHRAEDFEKSDPGAIQSTINIAARDGKLIVKSGETGPNKAQMVTMFDGRWSIAYDTSHTDEQPLDQADIQVGPVLWMTAPPLPLPGAGLPFAPLISPLKTGMPALIAPPAEGQTVDARILDVDGTAGWGKTPEAPYSSGTARVRTVDGKSQVLQLIKQGRVREQWDYSNHVLFSGIWIARHIEFRQSIDGVPNSITTYDLKDFHTDAPPLTDFSIDHRLVDLESVNYHEGDKTLQFRFRRGAGAWQDQANSAEVGH